MRTAQGGRRRKGAPRPATLQALPDREAAIQDLGRALLRDVRLLRRTSSVSDRMSERLLEWAMCDASFKTALFRFVDVYPTLTSPADVARHIREYFGALPGAGLSGTRAVASLAGAGPVGSRVSAAVASRAIHLMARRFIAGATPREALPVLRRLWLRGVASTVDLLGEATLSSNEALRYQERYADLLETLAAGTSDWPAQPLLERDHRGRVPRVNVSVKLSALHNHVDPVDFEGSVERLAIAVRPILQKAVELGAFVHFDVEQYATKDIIYTVFLRLLQEDDLRQYPHVGIVCQAYLRDALDDLERLRDGARNRGQPITVRLVKGAYWDIEIVRCAQEGHRCPVYTRKQDTDASFERCVRFLAGNADVFRVAVGSHNVRSIAAALVSARAAGLPDDAVELQMLFGMAPALEGAIRQRGLRLRQYVPVGELVPGMSYLVRRLLENTSSEGFVRQSFVEQRSEDELLASPTAGVVDASAATPRPREPGHVSATDGFKNEPHRDFTQANVRTLFRASVHSRSAALERAVVTVPLYVAGRELQGEAEPLCARDPACQERIVSVAQAASVDQVNSSIAHARAVAQDWRAVPAAQRAALLVRAAAELRRRRDEIAALELFEVGKPWREADADVCEAIDFLEYYARAMRGLERRVGLYQVVGEHTRMLYVGRGVAAIIAPWNFPLAIVTGMTAAALVTGNSVVIKPAEQAPATAWCLVQALRRAGAPPGTITFLPGRGEIVGRALVEHPDVTTIAFTGSRAVGKEIMARAVSSNPHAPAFKRVIAEMGGKNAIIVDDDADLDEAVRGLLASAFGYSGQKCSACSRVIALESVYRALCERLADAVRSLRIGPARDPASQVVPLVDRAQHATVHEWRERAAGEGTVLVDVDVSDLPPDGLWAGPLVVEDIAATSPVATEEIFGPVLTIFRCTSFEEAVSLANAVPYGLTGGVYSRSPARIAYAMEHLHVGNLYVNRPITGARVGRHPFGGVRCSGVGFKAGGPDYLLQFLDAATICENTVRRGFTPELDAATLERPR